jgi:glycerophosphoryl diester phosphodiesterase
MVTEYPLVIGHRGASAAANDNTLAAYALAVAQDADGIEIDVRLTADGHPVLHHDATLPDGMPIAGMGLADLRKAHPHVPTLDEMLTVSGDLLIDVEIKNSPIDADYDPTHRAVDVVASWIATHRLSSRTVVTSFNWESIARMRAQGPGVSTGQLLEGPIGVEELVAAIADAGHEWVLPSDSMLGPDPDAAISAAHDAGLRVGVWTVDQPARMVTLAATGVDAIVTNDPALAVATLS